MADKKAPMSTKNTLIITGIGAALVALITFLPATQPVVTAVAVGYLENNGYTVIAPPEPVSTTTVQ